MTCVVQARVGAEFVFDCLAVTAPNPRAAGSYLEELRRRLDLGPEGSKQILIVCVPDPLGIRVGSGGGTLNALLEVDDALREAHPARGGMENCRVLLVHSGGDSQRSPTECVCGKAWSTLNSPCHAKNSPSKGRCNTPMDLLLTSLNTLFGQDAASQSDVTHSRLPSGTLVVASCDVMLLVPPEAASSVNWSLPSLPGWSFGGVTGLAIAADAFKYSQNHGVYVIEGGREATAKEGQNLFGKSATPVDCGSGVRRVERYLQKPGIAEVESKRAWLHPTQCSDPHKASTGDSDEVAVDTGVVIFEGDVVSTLLSLARAPMINGCTTRGIAKGTTPLRLELYSDIMLALTTTTAFNSALVDEDAPRDVYLAACGPPLSHDDLLYRARVYLWEFLRFFPLGAVLLKDGAAFVHLGTTKELCEMITLGVPRFVEPYGLTPRVASVVSGSCLVETHPSHPAVFINSRILGSGHVGVGAIVEHSWLEGYGWDIGSRALVSCVRSLRADHNFRIRPCMCLQETSLEKALLWQLRPNWSGKDSPRVLSVAPEQTNRYSSVGSPGGGGKFVLTLFSTMDKIKDHHGKTSATFCNVPWKAFFSYVNSCVNGDCLSGGEGDSTTGKGQAEGDTASEVVVVGPEDIWKGVTEAERTLWQARVFPILESYSQVHSVLWMQDVQDYFSAFPELVKPITKHSTARVVDSNNAKSESDEGTGSIGGLGLTTEGRDGGDIRARDAVLCWLNSERVSFKDILARANPEESFSWRRTLEDGLLDERGPATEPGDSVAGGSVAVPGGPVASHGVDHRANCASVDVQDEPCGGSDKWDAVVVATRTLQECGLWMEALSTLRREGELTDDTSTMCVPPADPPAYTAPLTMETNKDTTGGSAIKPTAPSPGSNPHTTSEKECVYSWESPLNRSWNGPLVLNAVVSILERYSALKRGYFGSETSSMAVAGMRVLLFLPPPLTAFGEGSGCEEQHRQKKGNGEPMVLAGLGRLRDTLRGGVSAVAKGVGNEGGYEGVWTFCCNEVSSKEMQETIGVSQAGCVTREDECPQVESMFHIGPESLTSLLHLCQSEPLCQALTYLGTDNAYPVSSLKDLSWQIQDDMLHSAHSFISAALTAPQLLENPIHASLFPTVTTAVRPPYQYQDTNDYITFCQDVVGVMQKDEINSDTASLQGPGKGYGWSGVSMPDVCALEDCAASSTSSPAQTAQSLARVACHLLDFADSLGGGGHKSGPGKNRLWASAMAGIGVLTKLPSNHPGKGSTCEDGRWGPPLALPNAVSKLRLLRETWLERLPGGPNPQLVVRCARHYERAAGLLVSAAVDTVSSFIDRVPKAWTIPSAPVAIAPSSSNSVPTDASQAQVSVPSPLGLPLGASVTSRAAARVDLAGGWTDTPPVCYEEGAAVLNIAITVDGRRPLEAMAERIPQPWLELVCEGWCEVMCTRLEDLEDYCVPQAPAALLKAVLLCAGVISMDTLPSLNPTSGQDSANSLTNQIVRIFGSGGLRVTSRSMLPQGSGMGTSSILAGALLSSVCIVAGRPMSRSSLLHAVLKVEQMMTSGGGYQDQVGGLIGGAKISRAGRGLPLEILTEVVSMTADFEEELNQRLVLVFTGKQRLARDLLQGVVRGWHDRLPATCHAVKALRLNAENAARVCEESDIEALGKCLTCYWEQKKLMAPGAEPQSVATILSILHPICLGLSVCGAGGGGFIACITKSRGEKGFAEVTAAVSATEIQSMSSATVHRACIDPVGLEVDVDMG